MRVFISHLKKLDWILIVSAILLVGIGLLSIYSSSITKGNFANFYKQIAFFVLGFCLLILISFFDWRLLKNNPYLILSLYFFCLISLIGLFFFAPEIRGIRGWYRIGPFSFDPVPMVNIVMIILLAKYFSMRHIEMYRVKHIILSGIYVFLPVFLIILQPDLGSALIFIPLWLGVLIISGIKLRHFAVLMFCALLVFALSWAFFLEDHHRERIITLVAPEVDPLGIGWQQAQSRIAIGSGGIFGQGIGQGSQVQYGFLPEPQTDFIWAAIAEEMGLIGIIVLLSLFSVLLLRIIRVALLSQNNFSRIFSSGLVILLISYAFINIAMNLGLLPVIGLPLPLVSYGGSSLIAIFIGLGVLQSLRVNR